MDISYHKGLSRNLGRDMEYKRYGHAGRLVFPTSQGGSSSSRIPAVAHWPNHRPAVSVVHGRRRRSGSFNKAGRCGVSHHEAHFR